MPKSTISVNKKRRPGRPATGFDPAVSARLPEETIRELDAWAKSQELTRGQAIRRLIELGLKGKRQQ